MGRPVTREFEVIGTCIHCGSPKYLAKYQRRKWNKPEEKRMFSYAYCRTCTSAKKLQEYHRKKIKSPSPIAG